MEVANKIEFILSEKGKTNSFRCLQIWITHKQLKDDVERWSCSKNSYNCFLKSNKYKIVIHKNVKYSPRRKQSE